MSLSRIRRVGFAEVSDSVLVPVAPDAVWAVVIDPTKLPVLDPRVSLLEEFGAAGDLGSGYIVRVTRGRRSADLHYLVVESTAPNRLRMTVQRNGRDAGSQLVETNPEREGTRLTWTTRIPAQFGTAWVARQIMRPECRVWLKSVAGLVRAGGDGPQP